MRILVVEDDAGIAQGLRANLRQRGYAVDICDGITSAWAALCTEPFDAVLLDLGLCDGDGSSLLQRLRAHTSALPDANTPVLIMTARDGVQQRIAGLNQGADDYLSKPFDMDELEARLRALLRRAVGRAQPLVRHGAIELNPATRVVCLQGERIDISPREFAILQLLMESPGRVLSRRQLEERLYDWDSVVDSNAIEVHIHHLRRKLGSQCIQTMRGVGYFMPPESA